MDKLKNYILTINDDLLIKLSSKGLLKRAYKDYEKKGLVPEIIEGPGEVSWEYPSGEAVCSLLFPTLQKQPAPALLLQYADIFLPVLYI